MIQQPRALAAFAEDLGYGSQHPHGSKSTVTPVPEYTSRSAATGGTRHSCSAQVCMQALTHTKRAGV